MNFEQQKALIEFMQASQQMISPPLHVNSLLVGVQHGGHWSTSTQVHGNPGALANQNARAQLAQQAFALAQQGTFTEPETIEDTGIELGEVVAWRVWRVERGWLYSMVMGGCEWEPGETVEAHKIGPILGHGIHAFKTRKRAIEYAHDWSPTVVGRVLLWGQIYEFDRGWHGEFARIHSLDLYLNRFDDITTVFPLPSFWRRKKREKQLEELRRTYGVEA